MRCRPGKWLLWTPLAALPFLAAWSLNSDRLEREIETAAAAALSSVGADWAKLGLDGRDATLTGEATSEESAAAAGQAVVAIRGVRRVDAGQVRVVVPVVLAPPTITSLVTNNNRPELRGTWPEGLAKTLALTLPDRTYNLGKDPELASDGKGNWTWFAPKPMTDGSYEISVEVTDGGKSVAKTAEPGKLVVDTLAPPAPKFLPVKGKTSPESISGTWAEGDAVSLRLGVYGKAYQLGKDEALTSQSGKWTLALPRLAAGNYDLAVETADEAGNASNIDVVDAIVVAAALVSPTVEKYAGNDSTPVLTGSFDEANARGLSVAVSGRTYVLATDSNLTTDKGGRWSLAIGDPLKDGYHDVVIIVTDAFGETAKDTTVAEVVIDTTGPSAPTVERQAGNDAGPEINGTWPEGDAKTLSVAVGGKVYVLGKNDALRSTAGKWTLESDKLPDGYHDVVAIAADAFGNETRDSTVAEVIVDTAGPAAPTVNSATALPASGTFAAADTRRLRVTLGGKSYVLGKARELTANGDNWTLSPAGQLLAGTYDVAVAAADRFGNITVDTTRNELMIGATTEPPPPPPLELTAPTVNVSEQAVARPAVSGTWPEGAAKSLKVMLAGTDYDFGTSAELTSAAGVWMLKVPAPLKDGVYDVVAEVTSADGESLKDSTTNELTVDAAGPMPPTVTFYAGHASPLTVSGTWAEGDATSLAVTLDGKEAKFGGDQALASDGKGNWTLDVSEALKPGSYDVAVVTADKRGRMASDETRFEILVKEPKTIEPPPPPPTEMKPPTVNTSEQLVARPVVSGTWSEGIAKSLAISIAETRYALGTDDALKSSGGAWSLTVPAPLADGTYDVAAETSDDAGKTLTDATKDELVIDAAGPATPTVRLYSGETSPSSITGTWAEGDAQSLTVTIAATTAKLGADQSLASDGKGNWTLALLDVLKSGSYDVAVVTADKYGRVASDQTRFEILVKEGKAVEPPPPPKVDCSFELTKTLIVAPILFESDKSALPAGGIETVKKLTLTAGQCPKDKLEIGGHTDDIGSDEYNQALSERRAIAVMKALIGDGVAANRLSAAGYGETMPLATNETEEGRTVNRRIEIKIVK